MKTFILILLFAAFLQTTIVPINLVLILLICRSFIKDDPLNLIVAFGIGIFLGILSVENIGFWAIVFLLVVKIVMVAKKLPITGNFLTIIPIGAGMIAIVDFLQGLIFSQTLNPREILIEILFILPIYLAVRFWEERFEPPAEIKLKLKS